MDPQPALITPLTVLTLISGVSLHRSNVRNSRT
jgi:hypothetical protein